MNTRPEEESPSSVPPWQDAAETRRATRASTGRSRTRDVDIVRKAQLGKIVSWSSLGGVVGALLGVFGQVQGVWGAREVLLFAALGWAIAFVIPLVASSLSGRAARGLYTPTGGSTPHVQGFSHAESFAARGMFEEGVAAFEAAVGRDPRNPIPYLEIARIYRDRLRRYDDAAHWFKRALRDASLTREADAFTRRELVELYVAKLGQPARAAPVLARMAEEHAGSRSGDWAARELAEIKARIAEEAGLPRVDEESEV